MLLHGFLASSEYWQNVAELSDATHRIVTLDLLGFGRSPKPRWSRYDYEAHLTSIDATLKHLGIAEPFTLVGHSMGSLLALRYATLHPKAVQKLLLVNMPMMIGRKQVRTEILQTNFLYNIGLRPLTHRFVWAGFRALHRTRMLPPELRTKLRRNAFFFQHNAESRIRSFQRVIAMARADLDLAMVHVRTQVISGIDDRKVYLDNLQSFMHVNPYVQYQVVATGHHIPSQKPETIVRHFDR